VPAANLVRTRSLRTCNGHGLRAGTFNVATVREVACDEEARCAEADTFDTSHGYFQRAGISIVALHVHASRRATFLDLYV
jgi:hypothetical protein